MLEKALRRKTARHRQVRSDDTVIVASTTDQNRHSSPSAGRKGEKRGKSSVTQRLPSERDAQIDVEESTSGGKPIWHSVSSLMRCDSSTCQHGPRFWREEQDRLERDRPKGGHITRPRLSYPPINIHLISSPSAPHGLEISAPKAADNLQPPSPLDIFSLRDVPVKEYGDWQVSNVENDSLKTVFREVCDVMLENGLDLEQVGVQRSGS
ncbi:unnamed protein product [Penicillium nalgiovense]|nr:unnamed protein product [Penicillium nalgiovense]